MVKFGKQYRLLQLDEWKKYYLDYKGLKHKIRLMKRVLVKDLADNEKANRPSLLSTPILPEEIEKNEELFKDKKGEHLKEFIDLLIKEFQKSYAFFAGIEKALTKKINTHLYTQTSYSTYSIAELSKEMKSLSLTIYLAKCLNAFVNDIMMAIKKILKKFDKNFAQIYGLLTPHIILKLLSKDKSQLEHMLQLNAIDEISIISEKCASELKKYFDQNNDNSNKDNLEYSQTFLSKYNDTLKYIRDIDELIYFKSQYRDWVDYISKKKDKKSSKILENDIFNPILSASYYKDNLLDKFLSTKDAFEEIKTLQKKISLVNKRNIILIFTQSFFYNSLLTCIFPVLYYYEYIKAIKQSKIEIKNGAIANSDSIFKIPLMNVFIFMVVASTYFGQWISIFLFYNYMSIKKIKFSYILSYSFILVGSLIYILSIFYRQGHYKLRAVILGGARLLIGFGANPMIGKKYLTLYTPKYLLPLLSKIYLIIEISGLILGPCISALFCFISIGEICSVLNCIGYYGVLGSIILIIINHFLFIPPGDDNFSVVINQTNDDVNISVSKAFINNNFEDDEDTQDKEFYRLQKEKNEKKKAGLEPTKSDEVQIEVNDNEPTKSNVGISNTASNANFKDEKEEDDTNYNKIIENAGEGPGQNEIAENYYNNVDIGRYSDLDISHISTEERDTMQALIDKLIDYQEKSNFTYINMVPRTLDDIILNEQKTFGYMNRNFAIMLILLLTNNLIKENLIMFSSYSLLYLVYNNGNLINDIKAQLSDINKVNNKKFLTEYTQSNRGAIQIICLLISTELILQILSIFFIMPFYKVNVIFKKNLIIFMIASIIFMLPLSLLGFIKEAYIPIVAIDILLHKIIEVMCSCYLVYLIPPQWKYAHMRASSLPIYLMTLGKMFACFVCFIAYDDRKRDILALNHHLLILIAFVIYGLMGLIIAKSPNFRVKALARVLRKRAME